MSGHIGEPERNENQADRIVETLKSRPETLDGLCFSLGMSRREAIECVDALRREHVVQEIELEGLSYYTLGW